MSKVSLITFHPFLFSAYAILALLAHNVSQISINAAFRSLAVALLTTLLALFLLKLVVKDWHKAAIVVSIFIIFFFSYGHIYNTFEDAEIFGLLIGRHRFLLLIWSAVIIFGSWWAIRSDSKRFVATQMLNIVATISLMFPILHIASYRLNAPRFNPEEASDLINEQTVHQDANLQVSEGEIPPDIYYIILDMYVRDDVLSEMFHYDNSPFLNSLIDDGFFVARCSQSNYTDTPLSIASSLNLNYLETFAPQMIEEELNHYRIEPYVDDSVVRRELTNLGYAIVNVESGFFLTEWRNADIYLQTREESALKNLALGGVNEFESMLLYETAAMMLNEVRTLRSQLLIPLFDQPYIERRNQILYAFEALGTIANSPGPKFVFVHIVAPHPPFVFGPNGEFFPRTTPLTLNQDMEDWDLDRYIDGYTGQVTFLNNQVLIVIQNILKTSATPPIIIIQADHGTTRFSGDRERVAILNAYYLPAGGNQKLYHSISPVNSFRLIFDTYFNGDYGLLEDVTYLLVPDEGPYDFRVIPNTRQDCVQW